MNFIITWLPTTLTFIILLGILVFIHELGHFLAARLSGMKVEEFAFGFPPRIWGKKIKGTLYAINLIPLGGYVKILGEDEKSENKHAFGNRPLINRVFVVVAGVLMNFVLAYVAMMVLFFAKYPPVVTAPEKYGATYLEKSGGMYIDGVSGNSLAEKNGIQKGDFIYQVNSVKDPGVIDLRSEIKQNQGGKIEIGITRNGQDVKKTINVGDEDMLGVSISERVGRVKHVWYLVPYYALIETGKVIWMTLVAILVFLKNLIIVHEVPAEVMGPVGIFGITSVAVKLGFGYILNLLIALTVNLGIINILPFPALDGGRLVFLLVEKARGKKIKENIESIVNMIGFYLLIALAVLITVRDVLRL